MRTRTYDKEFKLNAIELCKKGKSLSTVSRDLDIPIATLYGWLERYNKDGERGFPGSGNLKDSDKELHYLKKELANVQLERDILKKALAIFSRPRS
ncbi:MAG: transposase [Thaumarchaeota archaeon]|nr:transposase [Nitrososphaerota archaeon]